MQGPNCLFPLHIAVLRVSLMPFQSKKEAATFFPAFINVYQYAHLESLSMPLFVPAVGSGSASIQTASKLQSSNPSGQVLKLWWPASSSVNLSLVSFITRVDVGPEPSVSIAYCSSAGGLDAFPIQEKSGHILSGLCQRVSFCDSEVCPSLEGGFESLSMPLFVPAVGSGSASIQTASKLQSSNPSGQVLKF